MSPASDPRPESCRADSSSRSPGARHASGTRHAQFGGKKRDSARIATTSKTKIAREPTSWDEDFDQSVCDVDLVQHASAISLGSPSRAAVRAVPNARERQLERELESRSFTIAAIQRNLENLSILANSDRRELAVMRRLLEKEKVEKEHIRTENVRLKEQNLFLQTKVHRLRQNLQNAGVAPGGAILLGESWGANTGTSSSSSKARRTGRERRTAPQ